MTQLELFPSFKYITKHEYQLYARAYRPLMNFEYNTLRKAMQERKNRGLRRRGNQC